MGEFVDKIKGNVNEAVGKSKQDSDNKHERAAGRDQELKGKGQQLEGEVKGKLGDDI